MFNATRILMRYTREHKVFTSYEEGVYEIKGYVHDVTDLVKECIKNKAPLQIYYQYQDKEFMTLIIKG